MKKERLDLLLVERNLATSREKAKALIMAGQIFVAQKKVEKAGTLVDLDAPIEVKGQGLAYVSRGGLKLEKALNKFSLDLQDKILLDIGASTGGFTDCALKKGVKKAFCVDVGYGQLDWSLRQDPRVINLERTNARYLTKKEIPESVDLVTIDVAFISLEKILPVLPALMSEQGSVIALIKPQFEAGREHVGKKGVVKDPQIHISVIKKIVSLAKELGLWLQGLEYSPIRGPEGNIEYLLWLKKEAVLSEERDWDDLINKTVLEAHKLLQD